MSIRIVGLTRRYGRHRALDDVSLHVDDGDVYGLIGHNGAGKTTTLRTLLGLAPPPRKTVFVDGFDIRRHPTEARTRFGGLIETPGFFPRLDGITNLYRLARMQGLDRSTASRESHELIARLGLTAAGSRAVGAYSQGMRQRLGIAQALIGRPSHVVLDEPTNGLDPEGIADIRDILTTLNREDGTTIVISSHQLHELADICNRVAILRDGKLVKEGATKELLSSVKTRHRVVVDDVDRARRVFDERRLGVETTPNGILVDVGNEPPGDVVKALVEARVVVESFAAEEPRLEDVYLRLTRGGETSTSTATNQTEAETPERRAPNCGLWRVFRYEVTRLLRPTSLATVVLLPCAIAAYRIIGRAAEHRAALAAVKGQRLASTSNTTAYEGFAFGITPALMVSAFILACLASQSIAGEASAGTLRNLLLRPARRGALVVGKWTAVIVVATIAYAAVIATSVALAAWHFDFESFNEVLVGSDKLFPLRDEAEMTPVFRRVLWTPWFPFAALTTLGFVVGAVVRNSLPAISWAVGLFVAQDVGRAVARPRDLDGWLPSSHLSSPLGDTGSLTKYYADWVQGADNATLRHEDLMITAPAAWMVVGLVFAVFVVRSRSYR